MGARAVLPALADVGRRGRGAAAAAAARALARPPQGAQRGAARRGAAVAAAPAPRACAPVTVTLSASARDCGIIYLRSVATRPALRILVVSVASELFDALFYLFCIRTFL